MPATEPLCESATRKIQKNENLQPFRDLPSYAPQQSMLAMIKNRKKRWFVHFELDTYCHSHRHMKSDILEANGTILSYVGHCLLPEENPEIWNSTMEPCEVSWRLGFSLTVAYFLVSMGLALNMEKERRGELLGTSASLLVTSALLVVTRSH